MSEEFSRRLDVRIIKDEPKTFEEYAGRVADEHPEEARLRYDEYLAEFQPYRFRAKGANFEIVSIGERYFNEEGAINAVELLFGDDTTVYWAREYGEDRGEQWLRFGAKDRKNLEPPF